MNTGPISFVSPYTRFRQIGVFAYAIKLVIKLQEVLFDNPIQAGLYRSGLQSQMPLTKLQRY